MLCLSIRQLHNPLNRNYFKYFEKSFFNTPYFCLIFVLISKTSLASCDLYYEDMVTRPAEINMAMLRELIQTFKNIVSGVGMDNDQKEERFIVPNAPTLAGYEPDPDDKEAWESFHS